MIIQTTHYSSTATSARNSNTPAAATNATNTLSTNSEQTSEAIEAAFHCAILGTMSIIFALMNEADRQESLTAAATYPASSKNALAHAKWNQTASTFWLFTAAISSLTSIYFSLKENQENSAAKKGAEREPLLPIHINIQ